MKSFLCIIWILSLLLCPAFSRADADQGRVIMFTQSDDELTQEVVQAMEGQVSDLPITFLVQTIQWPSRDVAQRLVATEEQSGENTVAVFWVDVNGTVDDKQLEVVLYLADSNRRRVLVRRLETSKEGSRFEAMAIIVRTAIEAMLHGGEIGVEVPTPKPEPPKPQPPAVVHQPPVEVEERLPAPPSKKPYWSELSMGYMFGAHSNGQFLHGADFRMTLASSQGWAAYLGYTFFSHVKATGQVATIDVASHPFCLGWGWMWTFNKVRLGTWMSLSIDYVIQETVQVSLEEARPIDNKDVLVSIAPQVTFDFLLSDRVSLRAAARGEFYLNKIIIIDAQSTENAVLDDPFNVQPRLFAGILVII